MVNKILLNRVTTITTLVATTIGTILADLLTVQQQNVVGNYLQGISQVLLAINAQEDFLLQDSEMTSSLSSDIAILKEKIERLEKLVEEQSKLK